MAESRKEAMLRIAALLVDLHQDGFRVPMLAFVLNHELEHLLLSVDNEREGYNEYVQGWRLRSLQADQ
jgi:hypothetical protein